MTILDALFYFKHNVPENGFRLRLQMELIQSGPVDRASLRLRTYIETKTIY
jgi:hypothetical protein